MKISPKNKLNDLLKNDRNDLALNLKKLMELSKLNPHELSRRTNVKQPIIHRIISGQNKNPKIKTLQPIADYFLISISQLIGEKPIEEWSGFTSSTHKNWNYIPFFDINNNILTEQKIITECNRSDDAFVIQLNDDSMSPIFPKNSFIIIEPIIPPKGGDYILVKKNAQFNLRLYLTHNEDKYILPINKKYGSLISLDAEIMGVCIRSIYDHK